MIHIQKTINAGTLNNQSLGKKKFNRKNNNLKLIVISKMKTNSKQNQYHKKNIQTAKLGGQ